MNTRLQVEHPVTEEVTGLDLVRLQLLVAGGTPLPPEVHAAVARGPVGHAVEARLYAEDPAAAWLPSTGTLAEFTVPTGRSGVRVDSGVATGGIVSPHYDPMLAKVIAHAPTRTEAVAALAATLAGSRIHGVTTNRDLLVRTLRHEGFAAGDTDTGFLDRHGLDALAAPLADEGAVGRHAVAAALAGQAGRRAGAKVLATLPSGWRTNEVDRQEVTFALGSRTVHIAYRLGRRGHAVAEVALDGEALDVTVGAVGSDSVRLTAGGVARSYAVQRVGAVTYVDGPDGSSRLVEEDRHPVAAEQVSAGSALAPMPGSVVRVAVAAGDRVEAGQVLVVLEAMKMEHAVHAGAPGTVSEVDVTEGDQVETGRLLVVVEPDVDAEADADGRGVVSAPLRVANCSGFYGDRLSAAREMVDGGPIDVLTGDWLAELTMLILWKGMQRDPSRGWAHTFLTQMEEVLGTCVDRGIKVVTNAGGLNPAALADQIRHLADRLGLAVAVAHIEGDDLLPRLGDLGATGHPLAHLDTGAALATAEGTVVSANAYLGAWPIVEALSSGADVVICPRVTDASLVVGPAAWHHGWSETDWDALAGAVVAGHVIECGPQATGGNYAFFTEVPGLEHPGFPIAEVAADGSSVITKHPGTGGEVSTGTVTAQLLYEIAGHHYPNTDVVARFETVEVTDEGDDRVRLSGTKGLPAPRDVKVCLNLLGGWRNTMTFVLTGLDVEAKADLTVRSLAAALGGTGQFAEFDARLIRSDKVDAPTNVEATAQLRVTVKDGDAERVGRRFSGAATELALAGYPGLHLTAPPGAATAYGVYWPALVPAELVVPSVIRADGTRVEVPHHGHRARPGRRSSTRARTRRSPPGCPRPPTPCRRPTGPARPPNPPCACRSAR